MKTIPILRNHSTSLTDAIGTFEDGVVTLYTPFNRDSIADVFGNVGYRIIEAARDGNIKQLRVLEWSITSFESEHKNKLCRDAAVIRMLEAVENRRLTAVEAAAMIVGTGKEYK